jgi:hypothetical protein
MSTPQRKLSRDKSKGWVRRGSKKGSAPNSPASIALEKFPRSMSSVSPPPRSRSQRTSEDEKPSVIDELQDKLEHASATLPRSIIPDPLRELPAWFNKENKDFTAIPVPEFKMRYHIHNPIGPRWYKNHHLIPPHQLHATKRPPTVFSAQFPPMSSHDRTDASSSRTPSGSPLPTPDSSQVGFPDGQTRSRKVSQSAHDASGVGDPWNSHLHAPSPYDLRGTSPTSARPVDVRDSLTDVRR